MIPFPWNLMFRRKLKYLEVLNELGRELDIGTGSRSGYPGILKQMRRILDLDGVSLWLIDRKYQLRVKEAMVFSDDQEHNEPLLRFDEKLAFWQLDHRQPVLLEPEGGDANVITPPPALDWHVISLPLLFKDELLGALNLYDAGPRHWFFERDHWKGSDQLLRAISGQLAVFVHNKSLEANTTFYKEIHHRVKNNLQTVASLLRMQLRRLDRVSAEQALEESIHRILSIAMVHETLSQGEIGMVNLGDLVSRICNLLTADLPGDPRITVQLQGPAIMLTSREATSLALVVNELVQNALEHGLNNHEGQIKVTLYREQDQVCLEIEDNGRGLPADFALEGSASLGLTIVSTLVQEELRGSFQLRNVDQLRTTGGTHARVCFPLLAANERLQDTIDYEFPHSDRR